MASSPSRSIEHRLLRGLYQSTGAPPLTIGLWDGFEVGPVDQVPVAQLRIADRATLWKLVFDPWYQFGEAYSAGRLEIQGEIAEMLTALYRAANDRGQRGGPLHWLLHPAKGTSLARARKNIHHHYDIGNDFYRLWLDEQMLYTCAYFQHKRDSIEEAQIAKMNHVCKKLRLKPGETVVEAGCGWGSFALHMARHYDVTVKAYNISQAQVEYARRQAREQRLDDRVEFIFDDWRNIKHQCDAFVSIGMLEHVGKKNYRLLGKVIDRSLSPGGRGLIHSIGQNYPRQVNAWIERRIFPGGYPPSLKEAMDIFEPQQFSVLDVENLRLHYAETIRHWLARFEHSVERVRKMFDDVFVRVWRLYLCGSIAAFESGSLQLFQILFSRPTVNEIPWTRAHLYGPSASPVPDSEEPASDRSLLTEA